MPLQARHAPAATGKGISRTTLVYLAAILIAGAVGGLLYWIVAKWTGTQIPVVFGNATFLILMFLGALAAAVGVYVLTASDVTAIRTYVFAVLCGLTWQPVLSAGARIANNATASSQNAQVNQQAQQLQTANQNGSAQQVATAVQQTVPVVSKTLEVAGSTTDAAKKTEIVNSTNRVVDQFEQSAAKSPDASVDALQNVAVAADHSGVPSVAVRGVQSLVTLRDRAIKDHNLVFSQKIQQTLAKVAEQSHDPAVQKAASQAATLPQ